MGLVDLLQALPDLLWVIIACVRKLGLINVEDEFCMGKLLLLHKCMDGFQVCRASRLGLSTINDVPQVLFNKHCHHYIVPVIVVHFVELLEVQVGHGECGQVISTLLVGVKEKKRGGGGCELLLGLVSVCFW